MNNIFYYNMSEDLTYNLIMALRENNEKEIDKIIYLEGFDSYIDNDLIILYFDELFKMNTKFIFI